MPLPGGFDDGLEIGVLDFPAELGLGFAGVGVEGGWVSSAAGGVFVGDF